MNLYFESHSYRHVTPFDTKVDFQKNIAFCLDASRQTHYIRVLAHKEDLEGKEHYDGYEENNMVEVAFLLVKFALPSVYGYGKNLCLAADDESADWGETFERMIRTKEYKDCLFDAVCLERLNVYIERLYVHPQYRNKGIGQYLLNNLDSILEFTLNRGIHSVSAYLKPTPEDRDDIVPMDDPDMLALMKKCYKAAGFKQVGRSRVFIQSYTRKVVYC